MKSMNVTNFRKDIFKVLEDTVKYNSVVNVSTKEGNAVLMSEDDYEGIMETLYLSSIPGLKESIIEGLNAGPEEYVSEDDVRW
ncbi:type II toxin-antitoxin system Phd/YefM family antitoxin [Fenollaria sporofastidiosus]|uniref:type II toxin-antitoxin system Phd/YefM family antitoxin n=1 Tax=Fenollaria sporofastidiosus TaxID=2811778 RepID=UPI001C0083E0|nr:type II toxin-antitoxin system Phd/YefM family antitoxin [Fenollaria sporofastidiosus]